jgi:HEAT repeat protein
MGSASSRVARQITEDLAAAGVSVKHPRDLVDIADPYPAAIPVLIRWIDRLGTAELPEDDRLYLWETLARALTVGEARPVAGPALVRLFREPRLREGNRWAVGNALDTVADESLLNDLIALANDQGFGAARQMVVHVLGRVGHGPRREEVVDCLIGALDDETVVAFAIMALTKLRATRALSKIAAHIDSPIPIAKKSARTALGTMGPASPN